MNKISFDPICIWAMIYHHKSVLPFHVCRQNKLHPSKRPSQPLPDGDSVSTLCQLSHQDHVLIRASLPEVDWVSSGRQSRVLRQLGGGLHGSPCGLTVHSDFTVRLTNGGKVNRRNHYRLKYCMKILIYIGYLIVCSWT